MIASCPKSLGELTDPSFGATVEKLVEVASVYYECRTAVFGGEDEEQ